MSENETFQKKTSSMFVTVFIGFIVISFMFTGYQSFTGSPNAVAKVGDEPIKVEDYQREYNRQLEFYRGITGGKDLTNAQIKQFGLKQNALRNLVQGKLTLILGDELGVMPSTAEVKDEIKKFKPFLVNGVFSVDLYKRILAANRLNPQDFEKDMLNQVRGFNTDAISSTMPISNQYFKDINEFRKQKLTTTIVEINKEAIRRKLDVSKEETTTFLSDESNKAKVLSLFNERKSSLDQKEQVKARHILLKTDSTTEMQQLKKITDLKKSLTVKNFERLAKKNTEDPSGLENGGDLGWFSRGRMVPEFEKIAFSLKPGTISSPVKTSYGYHIILVEDRKEAKEAKLEEHETKLAQEMIRKLKNTELNELVAKVTEEVSKSITNKKALTTLKSKYGLKVESSNELNKIDGSKGQVLLESTDLKSIFSKGLDQSETYTFDRATNVVVVKTSKFDNKVVTSDKEIEESNNSLKNILGRKMKQEVLKNLEASVKIVDYGVLQ
ncbi:SurA N-terminal domain-containing protein [Halobacteriovorax sp. HLS]|uniref:peptidylprolyl isomerase n=1 Tax=Halobacteriovorax sp. HLS TaxID=2234000 RepID=UPI000FD961A1|nr:SurA N-terminal domain-containing protein [Halobacteriovorax sp. HLS]